MKPRGSSVGRKAGGAAKRVKERKEEVKEEAASNEPKTIVPIDQMKLTAKELDEEITRVLTADNPEVPNSVVTYSFVDKEYKGVPGAADEHIVVHHTSAASVLHTSSEEANEQRAWEKSYRTWIEDRRREKQRVAHEEGKELTEHDMDDDIQRNQFNFTERSAQTHNQPIETAFYTTVPLVMSYASGNMNQWSFYDAYVTEYDKLVYQANIERLGSKAAALAPAAGGSGSKKANEDPMHAPEMARALKIVERQVVQNAEDDIFTDFKFWEDASDQFRESLGTCLPLWKFEDPRMRKKQVTSLAWNPGYPDLFAVSYGSYDYVKQGSGIIAMYSLKNVGAPEYFLTLESGVLCMAFHPVYHSLLAVGCYDGNVKVFDIRRKENKPLFTSDARSGKHGDPVWDVKWATGATATSAASDGQDLIFYSISSDGVVAQWTLAKSQLKMEGIMNLRLENTPPAAAVMLGGEAGVTAPDSGSPREGTAGGFSIAGSNAFGATNGTSAGNGSGSNGGADSSRIPGLAAGSAFAFNPHDENMYLVGTEEGFIHKCSLDYTGQYLGTYKGHTMAVYAVRWNAFHPRVFISCSADWTVRMWDHTHPTAIMTFDLGTSVGDVTWAPYSSTVFAAITDEGKVNVYDLHANKHDQLCEQKIVRKARCTHVAFSERAPLLLVGDSHGCVASLKLSPNLRKITPIPVPMQKKGEPPVDPPSREEVEIRKMDRLLALSDAKISIITPIPGAAKAKKTEAAEGTAVAAEAAPAEEGDE